MGEREASAGTGERGAARAESNLELLAGDPRVERAVEQALGAAGTRLPVIITGPVGAGKATLARAVHQRSQAAGLPLVELDCLQLSAGALAAHLSGAECSAAAPARTGSLLLREAGALSPQAQRLLADALKQASRAASAGADGYAGPSPTPGRLLVTSSEPIPRLVDDGALEAGGRESGGAVSVELPGLGERRAEIPILGGAMLRRICERGGRDQPIVRTEVWARIARLDFPEGLGSLHGLLARVAARAPGCLLTAEDVDAWAQRLGLSAKDAADRIDPALLELPYRLAKECALEAFESVYFSALLERAQGNVSEAARQAGLDRSNFRRALRRAQLRTQEHHGPAEDAQPRAQAGRSGPAAVSSRSDPGRLAVSPGERDTANWSGPVEAASK